MLKIKLRYNYFIEIDDKNFTLKSEHFGTKKTMIRTHGYYPSIEVAIRNYIKLATLDVNDGQAMELQELLKKIQEVCNETVEVIKKDLKE